jgi:hypothetical protein
MIQDDFGVSVMMSLNLLRSRQGRRICESLNFTHAFICGHAIVFLTSKSASTGGNEETSHNCNGGQRRSVSYRRISGPLYTRSHGWAKLGANFEHFWPLVWPPSYYQRGVSHCGLAIYIKKES